ncbi:hypothetical protein GCM10007977_063410 [Dactylosporangium sucinum]|uniref:GIY-YIG domain-containing protein n=1 Tax=Dactylosporangium sucinum TaxID=1424081 RepID=A0A917U2C8_9ACTN|nr:hypothetical protein GCM10007977_063410 [Dactylosporangium sucinum]
MTRSNPRVQPPTAKVWRLYRFYDTDSALLYIGQTGREPLARLIEHLHEQGWAGEIARWEVDPRVWHSEDEMLAAEEAAIRAERPRHNWQHNEGNPHRVYVPKVGSYRHPGRRPATTASRLSPRWRRRRNWAAGFAGVWVAVTLLTWWADTTVAVNAPGRTYPIAGLLAGALIPTWRIRRQRDRRAAVAVITVACTLLWLATG